MEEYKINILISGAREEATILADSQTIRLVSKDIDITETGHTPFFTLKELRLKLEPKEIVLLINGCRKDVYPSGMQADFRVSTAYIHEMGKPGGIVVGIFDPTDREDLVSTIEQQEAYRKEWIASFKNRPTP